jgi:hypothetical protein
MYPDVSIPASPRLRAFLVIAALICLCVSSDVGPQFFPLPAVTSQVISHIQQDQAIKDSYAPRAGAQSFRVPMMVQSTKRADKEPPQSEPLVALPSDRFRLLTNARFAIEIGYSVCFLTSLRTTPYGGRAPPSLV